MFPGYVRQSWNVSHTKGPTFGDFGINENSVTEGLQTFRPSVHPLHDRGCVVG